MRSSIPPRFLVTMACFCLISSFCSSPPALAAATTSTSSKSTSSISVTCRSYATEIVVGTEVVCTGKTGGRAPTGVITWDSDHGAFYPSTCSLSSGQCAVQFYPSLAAAVVVTAIYGGDLNNLPSNSSATLSVAPTPTTTTVSCNPVSVVIGAPTTCTASVAGYSPEGTVTWSGGGVGNFTPSSCALHSSVCSVSFVSPSALSFTIVASYGGDPNNIRGSGATSLQIGRVQSSTTVACSRPANATLGFPLSCQVTVRGHIPTGTVDLSSSSITGTFSPSNACSLSGGSCQVSYSDSTVSSPGSYEITAAYEGDTNNTGSEGHFFPLVTSITVAVSSESQTILPGGGGGIPDYLYELLGVAVVVLLIASYLVVRNRNTHKIARRFERELQDSKPKETEAAKS